MVLNRLSLNSFCSVLRLSMLLGAAQASIDITLQATAHFRKLRGSSSRSPRPVNVAMHRAAKNTTVLNKRGSW